MDKLSEVVINYLEMNSTGALFITGDWGSGKTFHLKNKVFSKIEELTGRIPIIVSLFGESDKSNIGQRVMFAYLDKKGKEAKLSTGTIAKNLKHLAESFPKIKEYVDVEKLAIGTGENLFRILPHNKLVIVFDDLERMGDALPVDEFLGLVNDLVENNGCKVILVANEAEIDGGIAFKEKTIEKTFHFVPDIEDVFNSIIKSYDKSLFKDFLNENRAFFTESIDISAVNNLELRKSYSNIRTLKFAVEHFRYVFSLFPQKADNFIDSLIIDQLKNLWYFVLAISIEFRKPNNITYTNRKSLDTPPITLADLAQVDIGFGDQLLEGIDDTQTEDYSGYVDKFKKLYFDRFAEQYIFHESVYDLITGGRKIDFKQFRAHLEKSFNAKDGEIPLGHKILNKIQHEGYWSFTNEEFVDALIKLLECAQKGELNDFISYVNSAVFIIGFKDLIQKSADEVIDSINKGVDVFIEREKLSDTLLQQRELIGSRYSHSPDIQRIIDHAWKNIDARLEEKAEHTATRIETLFATDIESFVNEFSPDTSGLRSVDKAFLHKVRSETISNAVASWEPKEIMHVNSFLKKRFIDNSFKDYVVEELSFLRNLQEAIDGLDLQAKTLSNTLIERNLLPQVMECIKILYASTNRDTTELLS